MSKGRTFAPGRFALSLDGVQIASFSELQGITTEVEVTEHKTAGKRAVPSHELAHLIQQRANGKPVIVRLAKSSSDRSSLQKLQTSTRRKVKLTAFDERGSPVSAFDGVMTSAKGDVMQQEWELTYEAIQRVL